MSWWRKASWPAQEAKKSISCLDEGGIWRKRRLLGDMTSDSVDHTACVTRDWLQIAAMRNMAQWKNKVYWDVEDMFLVGAEFCLPVCLCTMYMPDAQEVKRGYQIPWNWNYRGVWATTWVLGVEFKSSEIATSEPSLHPSPEKSLICSKFNYLKKLLHFIYLFRMNT